MTAVPRILVLGATGAVGRAGAASLVTRGARVTVAGRDEARLRTACPGADHYAELELDSVVNDVEEVSALEPLLDDIDVVLSCAGPASRFAEAVALRALRRGVSVVDPGGEDLVGNLDALAHSHGACAVLGAGVQPGLTGLAVAAALTELDERPVTVNGWCGGLQPLTQAAVQEYLSAAQHGGRSGLVLKNGRHGRASGQHLASLPSCFPPTAAPHVHLDEECEAVVRRFGGENLQWFNVMDGELSAGVLSRCLSGEVSTDVAVKAAQADLFGATPYFTIAIEAMSAEQRAWARVSCRDSYDLTGRVAAALALLATSLPRGAALASSCLIDRGMWSFLSHTTGADVTFELASGASAGSAELLEEGEL